MNKEWAATLVVGVIGVVIFYLLGTWLVSQDFWLSTLVGWLCYGLCVFFGSPFIFYVLFFFDEYGGWIVFLIILLYLFGFLDGIIEYISEYISRFFNETL